MIVDAYFDDTDHHDLLDIPLSDLNDIEEYQVEFFKWLFDINSDHKYWVYSNGHKIGCNYGTDAFIEWLGFYNINARRIELTDNTEIIPTLYF